MSKLNNRSNRAAPTSPVKSTSATPNHEGVTGFDREPKGELYLLAVSNMVAESSFYENADDRDHRFASLVQQVAVQDPAWVKGFFPWLRSEGFMRTASVVGAAEAAKALCGHGKYDGVADMIDGSLQRPDEVGEFLAYWLSIGGGKNWHRSTLAVKDGLRRAIGRMYSERNWLKYDSVKNGLRFADIIQLVHPVPKDDQQAQLFKHILDQRYKGNEAVLPDGLDMLHASRQWRTQVQRFAQGNVSASETNALVGWLLDPHTLKQAGLTWEDVLSALGSALPKNDLWTSMIPQMGVMALLRNLRNFDEAGISDATADQVIKKISDPQEIAKSKQFPFRFLSAHRAVGSLRWAYALEKALNASLENVPELRGRTLILVDRSGSMFHSVSQRTNLTLADSAAVFGSALALRAESADLVEFGTHHQVVPFRTGDSVLRMVDRFTNLGGTNTASAVRAAFSGHDRVVILTDEQQNGYWGGRENTNIGELLPSSVPLYTWNLEGYKAGHSESGKGNRHTFGGLSDASFRLIPMLERRRNASWPWEK